MREKRKYRSIDAPWLEPEKTAEQQRLEDFEKDWIGRYQFETEDGVIHSNRPICTSCGTILPWGDGRLWFTCKCRQTWWERFKRIFEK